MISSTSLPAFSPASGWPSAAPACAVGATGTVGTTGALAAASTTAPATAATGAAGAHHRSGHHHGAHGGTPQQAGTGAACASGLGSLLDILT